MIRTHARMVQIQQLPCVQLYNIKWAEAASSSACLRCCMRYLEKVSGQQQQQWISPVLTCLPHERMADLALG